VFAFWPWVGEVNVQSAYATSRQDVSEKIGGLDPNRPQIPQLSLASFFFNFSKAAQQAFDPDEIAFRVGGSLFDQKRTITAAQFDFEGMNCIEKGCWIDGFDDRVQTINDGPVG
jgi:hypothetical protein